VDNPGLNSGLMIPQYTAASASQNKQLATPSSVDSIVSKWTRRSCQYGCEWCHKSVAGYG
jgi:histidine ammonia-lyase